MGTATDDYRRIRDQADRISGRLVVLHDEHIACRPGCHDCCTDLSVSGVEYAAILADVRAAGVTAADLPPPEPGAACAFLAGGLCGVYRFRPLICRTHGLPVAFRAVGGGGDDSGDDGDAAGGGNDVAGEPVGTGVSVSFCPKNFAAADPDDLAFGPDNTLDLDALNADLAAADARFAAAGPPGPRPARVPFRQLRHDLRSGETPNGER